MRAIETPDSLYEARLDLAARQADALRRDEAIVAAIVVGSTALRRCSPRADLDLVVITPSPPDDRRFETRFVDGVRVEIERLGRSEALDATTGAGWVWELRQSARLGCGVAVHDPDGFTAQLAERAAAMTPDPGRFEATLRGVYGVLLDLAQSEAGRGMEALRGCFDNLALLTLLTKPRRYQKAKWALADLLHAGEGDLVDAILAAYGVATGDTLVGARELIERTYAHAGLPAHEAIIAMGHAPDYAEASYVSRCLDDAEDLEASGRHVEAQYVAKFATRLAAALIGAGGGIVDAFTTVDLADRYLRLFPREGPTPDLVEAALAAADACRPVTA